MKKSNSKLILALALIVVLLSSAHIVAINSSGLQAAPRVVLAPLGITNYVEDFTNNTLEDTGSSTAPGWGTGLVTSRRDYTITQLDHFTTAAPVRALDVQGRKAYFSRYKPTSGTPCLGILNLTNPTNLENFSNRSAPAHAFSMFIDGDSLYAGCDSLGGIPDGAGDLYVYNVTNPYDLSGSIIIDSFVTMEGLPTGMDVQGHFLYLACFDASATHGFYIFDIEDPSNIVHIPNLLPFSELQDVDVQGHFAYLANGQQGLSIVNVSNPYALTTLGSYNTPGNATDVYVDGILAIVADGPAGVHFFEVSDPNNPTLIASINTTGYARQLALSGDTLFVADGAAGVAIIDINHPYHPQLVDQITLPYTWDVDLYGGILVVATDDGLYTYNTGLGLTSLPIVSSYSGGYWYQDIIVEGNTAYIAENDSLMIFNVKDPANPVLLNRTRIVNTFFRKLDLEGHYLYLTNHYAPGIYLFDVSDSGNPNLISAVGGSTAIDIEAMGDIVWVSTSMGGIYGFNYSNPVSPVPVGIAGIAGNVTGIEIQGALLYAVVDLGIGGNAFYVFDISNLAGPMQRDVFWTTATFYDIYVDGDVAYTADTDWPIVWNVTNPTAVTFNNPFPPPASWLYGERTYAAWGFGPYMLSSNMSDGVTLIDARNINYIHYMGIQPAALNVTQITVSGNYAYAVSPTTFYIMHLFRSAAATYQTGTAISRSLKVSDTPELISNATLNFGAYVPGGTSITFALSADGGLHWESVTPGVKHTFAYPGYDLRWTANITTTHVDASVHLYQITISYEHAPVLPITPDLLIIVLIALVIIIVVVIIIYLLLRRRKSE